MRSRAVAILKRLIRGRQIPIALAAPLHVPPSRFPPLKVFVRRPPVCAEPFVSSRHPKTFTFASPGCGRGLRGMSAMPPIAPELKHIASGRARGNKLFDDDGRGSVG